MDVGKRWGSGGGSLPVQALSPRAVTSSGQNECRVLGVPVFALAATGTQGVDGDKQL